MFQRCRNCKHTVHVTAQACTKCGFDPLFGEKFCQGCGTDTIENQVICTMCGIKLGKRKSEPEPVKPTQDNHTQSVINSAEGSTTQSVVVNVGSPIGGYNNAPRDFVQGPKSKVTAALLALFFGGLGVHKFYLGYNTAGIIILLISFVGGMVTFGVANLVIGLLTLIEFFIYLTMPDETFDATVCRGTRPWF